MLGSVLGLELVLGIESDDQVEKVNEDEVYGGLSNL